MEILKTKAALALGLSSALSVGTASANMPEIELESGNSIIAVSSPDLKVTVYDGIATLIGYADSVEEAQHAEEQISDVKGVDHVINMITWG